MILFSRNYLIKLYDIKVFVNNILLLKITYDVCISWYICFGVEVKREEELECYEVSLNNN